MFCPQIAQICADKKMVFKYYLGVPTVRKSDKIILKNIFLQCVLPADSANLRR